SRGWEHARRGYLCFSQGRRLYYFPTGRGELGWCNVSVQLNDLFIDLGVFLCHHARREIALEVHANCIPVNGIDLWNALNHFIDSAYQEARYLVRHDLRRSSSRKRDNRTPL